MKTTLTIQPRLTCTVISADDFEARIENLLDESSRLISLITELEFAYEETQDESYMVEKRRLRRQIDAIYTEVQSYRNVTGRNWD